MRGSKRGFTLVELLAAIAIIAALLVVAGIYIGGYIGEARQRADARTLEVLNDAITRYKTQGGGTSGFTAGAPIANILNRLQQPINWNGLNHQVMKTGVTYPASSLQASGTGSGYKFTRYNSYSAGGATSEENPMPYGEGVGYIAVEGSQAQITFIANSTTGYWAIKIGNNAAIIRQNGDDRDIFPGQSATFWACVSNLDPTPSGNIDELICVGYAPLIYVSALDVRGLTALRLLLCSKNQLTSLNLSGLTALQTLSCYENQLTSLNVSGCTTLNDLSCRTNQLTTLNISDCAALGVFDCQSNQLTSINWPSSATLSEVAVYDNEALTGSTSALNSLYATLPSISNYGILYIGGSAPSADDAIAEGKGWTISRGDY